MMLLFRRLRKGHFGAVGLGIAAAALAGGQGAALIREARAAARISVNRPSEVYSDGFVSSQACRACHPSQYASWHASYHRTMTQVATPETVAPSFDHVRVADARGEPMQLEVRGRELWARLAATEVRVVLTTGSHHQQIFWYATGNSRILGQLPAIWLTAERRWIPRRAAVMRPPGPPQSETGAWNGICVACHTTDGRPRFDTPFGSQPIASQTANTSSAEFGIACEACHGPSADHVAANTSVRRRYSLHVAQSADATITRPDRLDPKRSSQVCGQCHSVWEFRDAASERRANTEGLGFRPGHDLAASRFIVSPTSNAEPETMKALLAADPGFVRDTFWSDGMVRATGREYNALVESPCYKNARDTARTLSCYSCHTMHKTPDDPRSLVDWVDDQLSADAQGNRACLRCHTSFAVVGADTRVSPYGRVVGADPPVRPRADAQTHTHHRAESPGSSCYNCHMPYTTYGLLKTVRSHQISNPSVQATLNTGRPNACNLCHLDKTLAWTADALNRWYGTPRPSMADDEASIAASLVTLLKGDAGQRAIVAQSMGWADAQRASGTAWMAPYLALLLDDPYDAVRYIASRSLKRLPGFERFAFDFVAPPQARAAGRVRALETWRDSRPSPARDTDPALLFLPNRTFNAPEIDRLRRERDNRRVVYRE